MPPVARGDGTDTVFSKTGSGRRCRRPTTTSTDQCSNNVYVNNIGVVRENDTVASHSSAGCGTDASMISLFSNTVFANDKGLARLGDEYTSDNIITSGSSNVFAGD